MARRPGGPGAAWRGAGLSFPSRSYAIWALPVLFAIAWVAPPWTATDEPFHMLRAVSLAHGQVLGRRWHVDGGSPPGSGGASDSAIFEAFQGLARLSWLPDQPNGEVTGTLLAGSDAVKWHRHLVREWFGSTAQYGPVFYAPDIAAYWIGRGCGLHVNATLHLARMMNGLVFLGLAVTALTRARRLRPVLAALLMLPGTLVLAASANQDAAMIGTIALVAAEADRVADGRRAAQLGELLVIGLGLALALVAMGRPPYVALLLVLLACAPNRNGARMFALAVGLVGLWCVAVAVSVMQPGKRDAHPAAQLAALAAHPGDWAGIAMNTLLHSFGDYAWQFIGQLSWNDTPLPAAYLALAALTLAVAALSSTDGPAFCPRTILAGACLTVLGIFGLLYLSWTPLGADRVEGVEGRHFLPLAPALALALPAWREARRFRLPALGLLAAFAVATPAVVLHRLIFHFYVA